MTSPNPGGNDEVIRVVYQAVADYSQLLREVRRARTETANLKRDIDGLAGTTTARIQVTADTSRARADLAGLIRDAVIRARVILDAAAARTELANLARTLLVRARLVVDAAAAKTEIAAATRDATVRVRVTTDQAGLASLAAQLARLRDLTVRVAVRADTGAVNALRAQLAALRDIAVRVSVAVDDDAVARLRTAMAGLDAGIVKLAVDLDEAGVTERMRALLGHLESLGPVKIDVVIASRTLDDVERRLERLRTGDGTPGDDTPGDDTPDTPGDDTPAAGGATKKKKAKDLIPQGLSAAAAMIVQYVSLVAAAIPIVAALAAAAGTVAAAFVAAGAATGIFAVAAIGDIAKVTAAVQAYEKSGTLAQGPVAGVVIAFEQLKKRYADLQKATAVPVFAVFTRGLQIAIDLLDRVQPLIGRVADAIDTSLATVQDGLSGRGFQRFLDFVGSEGPHAIAAFTAGLAGMAGGVGRLLVQFEPFVSTFVDGFARAGAAFDTWAAGLAGNNGFQTFVDYAAAQIPTVISLVTDLLNAAVNLGVALAPLGGFLLGVADAAAKLIAWLPPAVLTAIVGALLGMAAAIKLIGAATAITEGLDKFKKMLEALPGRLGAAAAGASALRVALVAIGTATVIGAVLAGITVALSALSSASDRAAKAADTHRAAVIRLSDALRANKGELSAATREDTYAALDSDPVELSKLEKGRNLTNLFSHVDTKTAAGYASEAGVDTTTMVDAAQGNDKAIDTTLAKLKALQAQYDLNARQANHKGNLVAEDNFRAQSNAIGKVIDQFGSYRGVLDDAKDRNTALGDAAGGAADGITESGSAADTAGQQLRTEAQAADAVAAALQADFSADPSTARYNAATSAMDAYDQQVRAVKDAEDAQTAAVTAATRAQEDLSAARQAAVQRIRDVQRALRDMTLDEKQARLSAKESDQNLAKLIANGGSADEIEQARIDNERAHNNLNDLEQDKGDKKSSLGKELKAGVDGNRALQDAVTTNTNAQKALTTANTNLGVAATKLTELHLAFQTSAGSLGLTEDQVRKLRTNMDKIKDKTVKVSLNTTDAEAKLRAVLQGQYTLQLMAQHPNWSMARATAEAIKALPTYSAPEASTTPINPKRGQSQDPLGRAEGGPVPGPSAGAVYGPGTGTSDSVRTVLPVGGDVRLSAGEHIVTDAEVKAAPGGHGYLEAFRAGLRARRPWTPPADGYRTGGPITLKPPAPALRVPALRVPLFRVPATLPAALPGYAAGGAVAAATAAGAATHVDRSVTVNVGTITNAVPETAGDSLYRQVRKAVDGDL